MNMLLSPRQKDSMTTLTSDSTKLNTKSNASSFTLPIVEDEYIPFCPYLNLNQPIISNTPLPLSTTTKYIYRQSRISFIITKLLMHPCMALSVHMLSTSSMINARVGWIRAMYEICPVEKMISTNVFEVLVNECNHMFNNISTLFSGLRVHMALAVFTWLPTLPLGIYEVTLFNCMRDNTNTGVFNILQNTYENGSLLKYSYFTGLQLIPGFLTFLGFRGLVLLTLGSSNYRLRQYNVRYQILDKYIYNLFHFHSKEDE